MKVEMKDSGIEWIGEVPAHWETQKLKYNSKLQGGYAFKTDDFLDEGIPIIQMSNIKRGELTLQDAKYVSSSKTKQKFELREGDLLLGMSGSIGPTGSLGNFAVVQKHDLPAQLNQRVGRFICSTSLKPSYLAYVVQTKLFSEPLLFESTGTAQFNISSETVGNMFSVLPPLHEQQAIVNFLDRETARIDDLIKKQSGSFFTSTINQLTIGNLNNIMLSFPSEKERASITSFLNNETEQIDNLKQKAFKSIELLKEYKTSLISSAVTGKIDVRNYKSSDPTNI